MTFWDSSALVPLLLHEARSKTCLNRLQSDHGTMAVWWGSPVEIASAVQRKYREGVVSDRDVDQGMKRLEVLRRRWLEVEPTEVVRETAEQVLRQHDLRAADALQLASARVLTTGGDFGSLTFLTLDVRLRKAAWVDGFALADLDEPG